LPTDPARQLKPSRGALSPYEKMNRLIDELPICGNPPTTMRVGQIKITATSVERLCKRAGRRSGWLAILLGFAIFGLLGIVLIPIRANYVPNDDDIFHFTSSLLLGPGARWQDWFSRGYSNFADFYPDSLAPAADFARTAWMRPAFQFVIYLA